MGKSVEELNKEKANLKDVLSNLESSYRTAKVSEKNYNETKNSTTKKIAEIDNLISQSQAPAEPPKDKKGGKKEEKKAEDDNMAGDFSSETAADMTEVEPVEQAGPKQDFAVEIEKLKVLIDTTREEGKATHENIQGISENIGEIRSMSFQTEGLAKEMEMKIEKLEEEVSEVKPSEISKRLRTIEERIEKLEIYQEKADAKFGDLSSKINSVHEMLKSAGGIENMSELNKQIGKKADDVRDAMKYIERLASKAEKAFLEINKNLEDFHVYKNRQDNIEETTKDIIKSLDEVNVKMENDATKKDLSNISGDILLIKKQLEEITRVIPLVKIKLPEPIQKLNKDRDEVNAMLDLLEGQEKTGTISIGEYDKLKSANEKKLRKINDSLEEEWKKFEKLAEGGDLPEEDSTPAPPRPDNTTEPPKQEVAQAVENNTVKDDNKTESKPEPSEQSPAANTETPVVEETPAQKPKKKRGRPKKSDKMAKDNAISDDIKKQMDLALSELDDDSEKEDDEDNEENDSESEEDTKLTDEEKKELGLVPETSSEALVKEEDKNKPDSVQETKNETANSEPEKAEADKTETPKEDIDSFIDSVAKKYLSDDKTRDTFMKKVKEEVGGPEKHEEKKEEKKEDNKEEKPSKKKKVFEVAENIKEMMK